MTAKRNVDYFQRVCDATIMHAIVEKEAIPERHNILRAAGHSGLRVNPRLGCRFVTYIPNS